jgi:uncharacterized protein YjiS (DUF1127 family)
MAHWTDTLYHTLPADLLAALKRWVVKPVGRAMGNVLKWQERAQERHALKRMDDRMLKDMGLTRADVFRETAKPFWQP